MSYAGNPNLAPDVQKRILDTFRHTLDVAARGGLEEARLGCDFVLQLDPYFDLAQALSERLRGATGPLAVDDLKARLDGVAGSAPAAPQARPAAPAAPAAPRPAAPAAASRPAAAGPPPARPAAAASPPARPAASAPPPARSAAAAPPAARPTAPAPAPEPAMHDPNLRRELIRLVEDRDFAGLQVRAQHEHVAIAADPALQQLLAHAQELMEAAPYVERFLEQALSAQAAGRTDEARALLEKARALDVGHAAVAQALGALPHAPAAPPKAADPSFAPIRTSDPEASYELPANAPAEESFGDLAAGEELPMDLPPLELPGIGEVAGIEALPDELSLERLAAEAPPAAVAGGPSDPDPRIAELLDEGQAQLARGDLQGAIDAWSRIFLIDIDHPEAARRIDQARNAKAEQERQVEEAYQDALGLVQSGDLSGAQTALQRVLELQPNHVAARDVLAKLERGEVTDLAKASGEGAMLEQLSSISEEDLKEEILVPPEPGAERPRVAPVAAKPAPGRRMLFLAAGLVVVLGGAWFLVTRWSSLFPNTEAPPVAAKPASEQTPITRATDLRRQGKRAVAIAQLKRVPPSSPYYEEAQALIGQWQQEEAATMAPAGPSPERVARREELLAQARQAESERRFLAVGPLLEQAAAIAPLSEDEQLLRDRARNALEPLKSTLTLLRAEEYDRSLRDLWVILEKDSGNADARTLLTAAYYNKGVLSLQQSKPDEAEENLKEAAELSPADAEVQRLLQLAQTYRERNPDLLYRIYTKYLSARPL